MIEAMAAGRPVVTPAEGGGPEIVVDGETGSRFRPREVDALAEVILALLADPARRQRMGAAGRERVRTLFGLDSFVTQMTDLYRALSAEKGGPA